MGRFDFKCIVIELKRHELTGYTIRLTYYQ